MKKEKQKTWTTDELREDFEVIAFLAPYVMVKRRSDGATGTMMFSHLPRYYHSWKEDTK